MATAPDVKVFLLLFLQKKKNLLICPSAWRPRPAKGAIEAMKFLTALVLSTAITGSAQAENLGAFLAAQFASHQGNVRLAAMRIQDALKADPDNTELRDDAFVLGLLARSPNVAVLARGVPENPMAALLLSILSARAGNWQSAELGFAELPHDQLMDALRPLLMAWAQEAQGFADRAMDTLQPAIQNAKLGAICLLHGALIADAAQRDGLAQRLYADLAKAQAEPSLQFAELYSSFQARSGDMTAATATIDAAVRAAPELEIARQGLVDGLKTAQAPVPAEGLARAFVEVAAALRGQNHDDVAGLLVQMALELKPDLTDAHLLAADIASNQKQYRLASDELEGIKRSDPLMPVIELRKAGLYERQGRADEAAELLQRLAASYPDRAEPLAALGDAFTDAKKFDAAIGAYDKAIARLRHPVGADWVVFYARGSVLERLGQWPRAEADMNRALELSPDQPYVLNFLGYSLADRKENLPLAQDMLQKAIKARPNDGAIVDSMGWLKLREGNTREALRLLEKAAEMEPEDPSITGHLGDAYWDAGRHIEAEDQWRRALVLKPEPDEQARIEARLKDIGK
jgi:tetratricopeptide (TPR) repeat protein